MQSIDDRVEQPGYKVYKSLENLVLKAANTVDSSKELVAITYRYV